MSAELTEKQEKTLRHMLGAVPGRYRKNQWGFRNYYCADSGGGPTLDGLREMEVSGLIKQYRADGESVYFHVTEDGCKAIGLTKSQISRAFED